MTLSFEAKVKLAPQFWELDTDHDFYINKEDLLRYGNHSLTYRIVDRIFSQVRVSEATGTAEIL